MKRSSELNRCMRQLSNSPRATGIHPAQRLYEHEPGTPHERLLRLLRQPRCGRPRNGRSDEKLYEEYFAVADLPAEFYLETVQKVFQEYALPKGELTDRGRKVDPGAIRSTALLKVEGERDDICGIGQTLAAKDLCVTLKPCLRTHSVQAGVGQSGVFSGRRWNSRIYQVVRDVIHVSRY